MNLTLSRPLVFIDCETTGLERETDRIIDIALHKVFSFVPARTGETAPATLLHFRVNPGMPIPAKSTEIHGITDEDVAGCPGFGAVALPVYEFLQDCDIAGFNSNYFDVPMLHNEFRRCCMVWQPGHMIDVGTLFKIKEPRTLSAAVRFYTGKSHKDAHHTATGDAMATAEVFQAQLARYDLPTTVAGLAIYSNHGNRPADISGKFYYDPESVLRLNFGKHRGEPALEHLDFLEWMWRSDFPADTRELLSTILHHTYETGEDYDDDGDLPW